MKIDESEAGVRPSTDPSEAPRTHLAFTVGPADLKRSSVQGSLISGLAQVVKTTISIASQLILARLLFPADFGLLAMVFPVIGFVQVFTDLGLAQAIVQQDVLEQPRVSALFWANMVVGTALAVLVVTLSPVAALLYGEPRVGPVMVSLGLMIPIAAIGVHPAALLARQMRFGRIAGAEVVASIAGLMATVAAAFGGLSYWSLIIGQLSSTLVSNLLSWQACGWLPSKPAFTREVIADLKFGGNVTGANLAAYITTSGDNIIIGAMNGKTALGLYDRSYRLVVQPMGQMIAPIGRVAVPLLSRLQDRPDQYRTTYLYVLRLLVLVSVPGMLACIVNAEVTIDTLLGVRWHQAAPIFKWICVGGLTSATYSCLVWLFQTQGRTRDMRNFLAMAAGLNLASFLIGALWGAVAVAAAAGLGVCGGHDAPIAVWCYTSWTSEATRPWPRTCDICG